MSWRGAALPVGSSIGLLAGGSQKRLLAQSQPNVCLIPEWTRRAVRTVMEYRSRAGSFPGAACYQLIDLPTYKAAPLQAIRAARSLLFAVSYPISLVPPACTKNEWNSRHHAN
jgi:hypothetical protein